MSLYDWTVSAIKRLYAHGISTTALLDPGIYFPHAGDFQSRWQELRAEADQVASNLLKVPRFHELLPSQASISANDDRDWRMFVLKAYGVPVARNLARCPALAQLLADHPEVLSASPSFLAPGKHIPEHHGPFRGIVRFHLGLRVPLDAAGLPGTVMRVDGIDHRIGDGDMLLWDDTYRHEVWNRTEGLRVALLLDVRRSRLPMSLRVLTGLLVAAIAGGFRWRLVTGRELNVG
jgi:aspartate beta-hydroxylase